MRRRFLVLALAITGVAIIAAVAYVVDDDDGVDELSAVRTILAQQGIETDSDDDLRYYDAVLEAHDLSEGRYALLAQERLRPSSALAAAREAGAGSIYLASIERLRSIAAPTHYKSEHARLIALYERLAVLDENAGRAVADNDADLLVATGTDISMTFTQSLGDFSETLCIVLTVDDQPLRADHCTR
jgi:hypothetical protein